MEVETSKMIENKSVFIYIDYRESNVRAKPISSKF